MAILATITAQEDFIVQMNGDYNVPFDEVTVSVAGVAGQVIAVGAGYGILAKDKPAATAEVVRVMVRGNPTTVNAQALTWGELVQATVEPVLAEQGIIVVNK